MFDWKLLAQWLNPISKFIIKVPIGHTIGVMAYLFAFNSCTKSKYPLRIGMNTSVVFF